MWWWAMKPQGIKAWAWRNIIWIITVLAMVLISLVIEWHEFCYNRGGCLFP